MDCLTWTGGSARLRSAMFKAKSCLQRVTKISQGLVTDRSFKVRDRLSLFRFFIGYWIMDGAGFLSSLFFLCNGTDLCSPILVIICRSFPSLRGVRLCEGRGVRRCWDRKGIE